MATVWTVERGSETQKGNIQLQDRNGSLCQPCRVILSRAVRFQAGGRMQGWRRSRVCGQSGTAVSVLASGGQVRSPVAGVGALHSPTFPVFFFPPKVGIAPALPEPQQSGSNRIKWEDALRCRASVEPLKRIHLYDFHGASILERISNTKLLLEKKKATS